MPVPMWVDKEATTPLLAAMVLCKHHGLKPVTPHRCNPHRAKLLLRQQKPGMIKAGGREHHLRDKLLLRQQKPGMIKAGGREQHLRDRPGFDPEFQIAMRASVELRPEAGILPYSACLSICPAFLFGPFWGLPRWGPPAISPAIFESGPISSGASWGAPHGVATLEVRKGAFDTFKKGSGAHGK